jgi:MFS family permease
MGSDTILAQRAGTGSSSFPQGLHNAFLFAILNALSYQIVLSSPMVLYATTLGASATVLGVIAGMMPLLVIFQIPAANYISRVGFKRFVYAGWGIRVMFIFAMALVPLTGGFLEAQSRLALLLFLLFGFNLSRGISSCAWLPWLTALIPADIRGKYLVLEAAFTNLSGFCTFMVAAFCLAGRPGAAQFSALFAFSAVMGALSLRFLKQIPDAEMPERVDGSPSRVPWNEMISYRPFARLLCTVVGWSISYGGMNAFTVAFLKTEAGMSERNILLVNSVAFLGGLSSLWLLGSRLDRVGSKPVLSVSFAAWALVTAAWTLLAGAVLDVKLSALLLLQFAMGLLLAIVQMSNTRLAMEVIPPMGRNHFFAIYSVANNVTLGLAPIAWGLLIDAIGSRSLTAAGLTWNRFTWFFAGASITFLFTLLLSRRLEEPKAATMEQFLRELLIQSPQRMLVRFWPRE